MKNAKRHILVFTISIILISFVIVIISFNLMMRNYIKNEAINAINNEISMYKLDDTQPYDENKYIDPVKTIQVDTIFMTLEDAGYYDNYFTEREKRIIEYCKLNQFEDENINFASIKNEDFYIAQLHLKYEYLDEDKGIEYGYYKDTDNNKQEENIVLLYANVTPLKLFSKSMNKVFLGVLLGFALLSGYFGIQLGKKIENSQDKLKQFFQNVSHELKTPIMSIQGYAEGIQTGVIKDQSKATQIIIDESNKMSRLVEELLYISKIDSGQIIVIKEPIEVNELIYDCLRSVEMIAKNNGIEIKINFNEVSPIIYGDEKQLTKAFTNIIVNALKYASSQVSIECNEYKKYIEIIISDDGDGINEKDLPHVFERFYTGKRGSTGIGLALTKEIIEVHNGKITAYNIDKGAAFNVKLSI